MPFADVARRIASFLKALAKGGPLRRFSTWFFVVRAPEGVVTIDHGEIHEDLWLTPQDAMAKHAVREIELVPPTWLTLHQLAPHATVDEALAWAAHTEPNPRFWTRRLALDPVTLVWHGDAAYDTLEPATPGARNRLALHGDGWVYERSS